MDGQDYVLTQTQEENLFLKNLGEILKNYAEKSKDNDEERQAEGQDYAMDRKEKKNLKNAMSSILGLLMRRPRNHRNWEKKKQLIKIRKDEIARDKAMKWIDKNQKQSKKVTGKRKLSKNGLKKKKQQKQQKQRKQPSIKRNNIKEGLELKSSHKVSNI